MNNQIVEIIFVFHLLSDQRADFKPFSECSLLANRSRSTGRHDVIVVSAHFHTLLVCHRFAAGFVRTQYAVVSKYAGGHLRKKKSRIIVRHLR